MAWREAAEQALPPQRPSEPGQLRADILDELADHLAMATERERVADGGNEAAVWGRVLDEFGDPKALARRLWWDAMRETVMREWIQTGVMVVGVVAVILIAFLGLQQMQSTQQILQAFMERDATPSNGLGSIEVLVRRGEGGPPVEGAEVQLGGNLFGERNDIVVEIAGKDGRVTLGPVRAGIHGLTVVDALTGLQHMRRTNLYSGTKTIEVIAPKNEPVPLNIQTELPPESDDAHQLILAELRWTYKQSGHTWESQYSNAMVLLGRGGAWQASKLQRVAFETTARTDLYQRSLAGSDGTTCTVVDQQSPLPLNIVADQVQVLALRGAVAAHVEGVPTNRFYTDIRDGLKNFTRSVRLEKTAPLHDLSSGAPMQITLPKALWEASQQEAKLVMVLSQFPDMEPILIQSLLPHINGPMDLRILSIEASAQTYAPDPNGIVAMRSGSLHINSDHNNSFKALSKEEQIFAQPSGLFALPKEGIAQARNGRDALYYLALYAETIELKEYGNSMQLHPLTTPCLLPLENQERMPLGQPPLMQADPGISIPLLIPKGYGSHWLLADISRLIAREGDAPAPEGVLLRWEKDAVDKNDAVQIISAENRERGNENMRPCLIVMTPKAE
jgi:hypothetical protein